MRVVIAEDQALLREGMVRLLEEAGHEVVAASDNAADLLRTVEEQAPDLAIIDVRMPPTFSDEGTRAAAEIRADHPGVAILVLSQHIEPRHAVELMTTGSFGYLLKDRVLGLDDFIEAAERVAAGGSALDPDVVAALLGAARQDPLPRLSEREREVLGLMAEGRTNAGIARALFLAERTVETHVRRVLQKLDLPEGPDDHRRVLAVVHYLAAGST